MRKNLTFPGMFPQQSPLRKLQLHCWAPLGHSCATRLSRKPLAALQSFCWANSGVVISDLLHAQLWACCLSQMGFLAPAAGSFARCSSGLWSIAESTGLVCWWKVRSDWLSQIGTLQLCKQHGQTRLLWILCFHHRQKKTEIFLPPVLQCCQILLAPPWLCCLAELLSLLALPFSPLLNSSYASSIWTDGIFSPFWFCQKLSEKTAIGNLQGLYIQQIYPIWHFDGKKCSNKEISPMNSSLKALMTYSLRFLVSFSFRNCLCWWATYLGDYLYEGLCFYHCNRANLGLAERDSPGKEFRRALNAHGSGEWKDTLPPTASAPSAVWVQFQRTDVTGILKGDIFLWHFACFSSCWPEDLSRSLVYVLYPLTHDFQIRPRL